MQAFEPQTRFLVRGSALLIALLTLWWFVLLGPMLYLLKGAAGVLLPIEDHPSGDWTLRVPVDVTLHRTPRQPLPQQLRSIEFDMPRSDAVTFTFSIPVYWAIMLAAPGVRRKRSPLLLGTAAMAAIELVLFLGFAHITAADAAAQLAGTEYAADKWIYRVGVYLVVSVLPYAAPFVVALWLDRELREEVLSLGRRVEVPVQGGNRR